MQTENSSKPKDSGLVIGFSGTYYCLWSWMTETNYSMTGSGSYVASSSYVKHYYIKRISIDLNKVKELYPNIPIDMDLHGQKWERSGLSVKKEILPHDVFPYDFRGQGTKIMECNDTKFLWSLYLSNELGIGRSKVYARKRLTELGLLVPYKTSKSIIVKDYDYELGQDVPTGEVIIVRKSYCSPKLADKLEAQKLLIKGHFEEDGKRCKMMVKRINSFSFETQYGMCYVVEYVDSDNRVFKYKGANPPTISSDDFDEIQATIKHSEYKGQNETLIQRIKVITSAHSIYQ